MKSRKRMQPDIRRKQIIDTAVHLFYTQGYDGTSLRDLAERVGINKATIYHYFASKEEILYQILDEVGDSLYKGLREARISSADPLACLEAMVRFQILYMEENLERIKVLVEEQKSLGSEFAGLTKVVQAGILKLYENVLGECMKQGKVRKFHLATAAFSIIGQVNWLYHWYRPDGPLRIADLADEVSTILLHGLALSPSN